MPNTPVAAKIHLLPSDVINQIAAGEVVERPAHLVKELVENAIDSGATSIEIEYDQGGRRVRVTDNGSGISVDDLPSAVARHGTSKISDASDLWTLTSFGFRGEALASIGSVCRLSITTRTVDATSAAKLVCEHGRVSPVVITGGNAGTTVLVEELFTNVPARLKFLKSDAGESAQIKATLRALALANEQIEFRIRSGGKVSESWPPRTSFLERAQEILGPAKLYLASGEFEGARAEVAFQSPHDVGGNTRGIQIFVQNRWVQDRSLQSAVIDAYRGLLMHGEFPIAVVRLSVPTEDVDVNIHPTKSSVKFRDQQMAFRAVNRTLRAALETAPWLEHRETATYDATSVQARMLSARTPPNPSGKVGPFHSERPYLSGGIPEFSAVQYRQVTDWVRPGIVAETRSSEVVGAWSRLQVLGQAHLTYILAQDENRLVMIDQHAAHERVAYERLMSSWLGGHAESQPLLIPVTIELEPDCAEALMTISVELNKMGLQIDQNGPQSVAVRSLPSTVKESSLLKALKQLATDLVEKGGGFALERQISDLCATMACHSVVRAGQAMSIEQMKSLLKQMDQFPLSSFCPHGRPVSVDYPFVKLERDFGRTV